MSMLCLQYLKHVHSGLPHRDATVLYDERMYLRMYSICGKA